MLQISHISKAYGKKEVLKDLNFSIPSGTICGLVGKNGAGKTTLFHSILNFLTYEGKILLDDQPRSKIPMRRN